MIVGAMYTLTGLGLAINLYLLLQPPAEGNGITTLPFVLFMLLTLGASSIRLLPGLIGNAGLALLRVRRHLGINTALWGIGHAATKTGLSLAIQPETLITHLLRPEIIAGIAGLVILIALLTTSNDKAVRSMGGAWRKLHRLSWLLPGIALHHGHETSENFTVAGEMNLPVLLLIWILLLLPIVAVIAARKPAHLTRLAWSVVGIGLSIGLVASLEGGPPVTYLSD